MSLMEIIIVYLRTLQKQGRAAADDAVINENAALVAAVRASFNDSGKLINTNGKPVTIMDLIGSGIKSPL